MEIEQSPWGLVQSTFDYGSGIVYVCTDNHGGYFVDHEAMKAMPAILRSFKPFAGDGWYEETFDAWIVVAAFPDWFPLWMVKTALHALQTRESFTKQIDVAGFLASPEGQALVARAGQAGSQNCFLPQP